MAVCLDSTLPVHGAPTFLTFTLVLEGVLQPVALLHFYTGKSPNFYATPTLCAPAGRLSMAVDKMVYHGAWYIVVAVGRWYVDIYVIWALVIL